MYELTEREIALATLQAVNQISERLAQIMGLLVFFGVGLLIKVWAGN